MRDILNIFAGTKNNIRLWKMPEKRLQKKTKLIKKCHSSCSWYRRSVNHYHLNGSYFTCNVWQLLLYFAIIAGLTMQKRRDCRVNILVNDKKGCANTFTRALLDSISSTFINFYTPQLLAPSVEQKGTFQPFPISHRSFRKFSKHFYEWNKCEKFKLTK